jgi:hypothetical protein
MLFSNQQCYFISISPEAGFLLLPFSQYCCYQQSVAVAAVVAQVVLVTVLVVELVAVLLARDFQVVTLSVHDLEQTGVIHCVFLSLAPICR